MPVVDPDSQTAITGIVCRVHRAALACLAVVLAGCAASPGCVVGDAGGWTPLDNRPSNAGEILRNSPSDERRMLLAAAAAEWFVRDDEAYLICLPGQRPVCGQINYHIERTEDGWAQPFHYSISCP